MMTAEDALKIFEKVYFLHEQIDMQNDIREISYILSQSICDRKLLRKKIDTINDKHRENVILYNIIFPPEGNHISLEDASAESLRSDLEWKRIYLQAKSTGKTFDELCKEMRNSYQ